MTGHTKTNDLQQQLKHNKRLEDNRLFQFLFPCFFVAASLVGLFYSIYPTSGPSGGGILLSDSYEEQSIAHLPITKIPELTIEGELEDHQNITFSISPFDRHAVYEIDFGNGDYRKEIAQQVIYQYNRADVYQVKITKTKHNKTETILTKTLNIAPAPVYMGHNHDYDAKLMK